MTMKSVLALSLSIFLFLLNSPVQTANKALTETEIQIVSSIDKSHAQSLSLLEKVVNINSGTMNFAGVKKVGDVFTKEFNALDCKTQWIDGKSVGRAGHLFATCGSKNANFKGTKLLLIGHLDTVFASNSEFQSFKAIDDKTVAGPGIVDMKGGDVIIIAALKALKSNGALDQLQIKVIMTGDEEKRGSPYEVATQELVDAGKWADIALAFENGDSDPKTAVVSRRGSTRWQLNVVGRPAHSSQIFRDSYGYGSIFEAARILNEFRTQLSTQENLTFNPGVIVGGTDVEYDSSLTRGSAFGKNNVISQSTIVSGDIRALSPKQLTDAQADMQKIVAQNLTKTSATLTFFSGYPPMSPNEGNHRLLSLYSKASIDLGFGEVTAVDPRKAGAADVSFVASHVDMALDGLGLMGSGGHTIKEVADISTLSSQTKRAAILMYRLSKL